MKFRAYKNENCDIIHYGKCNTIAEFIAYCDYYSCDGVLENTCQYTGESYVHGVMKNRMYFPR